jgi:hypothetical protein
MAGLLMQLIRKPRVDVNIRLDVNRGFDINHRLDVNLGQRFWRDHYEYT